MGARQAKNAPLLHTVILFRNGLWCSQSSQQCKGKSALASMRSLPLENSSSDKVQSKGYSSAKAPIVGQETIREAAFAPIVLLQQ